MYHKDKNGNVLDKPRRDKGKRTRRYMSQVKRLYKAKHGKHMLGVSEYVAVRMVIFAFYKRPQYHFGKGKNAQRIRPKYLKSLPRVTPDRDNVAKIIGDPLNNLAYPDDKDIVSGPIEKRYAVDPNNVGVMVILEEVRLR